jgi:hypothetical protein
MAEEFDDDLRLRLQSIVNPSQRQVSLLDWYFARFLEVLEPKRLLRYEDLIATQGRNLSVIAEAAHTLPKLLANSLQSRNDNALYADTQAISRSTDLLLADHAHSCWQLYDTHDVIQLQATLLEQQDVDD